MDRFDKIIYDFDRGRVTGSDAACLILLKIDLETVDQLEKLSIELRDEVFKFIENYSPELRTTHSRLPSESQIDVAKDWLVKTAKS